MKGSLLRSMTFGIEDSLISTVGLVSGVAAGGVSKDNIILTGVILLMVEATSMAMGEISSEEYSQELESRKEVKLAKVLPAAVVMFGTYMLAGLVPLFPYLVTNISTAFMISIGLSVTGLFIYGFSYGHKMKMGGWFHGIKMAGYGTLAILVGVGAGLLIGGR